MRSYIRPNYAVAALTAIAVLTIVVSTALLLWRLHNKEIAHGKSETISLGHILAEQTTHSIQNVDLVLQNMQVVLADMMARGESVGSYGVHELLHSQLSGMPQVRGIFIVDAKGIISNSSRRFPSAHVSLADREYFTAHRNDPDRGFYIGRPTQGRDDGTWTLHVSRRLTDHKDEFRGVIAVALNLGYFEALYNSIRFDSIGPIALYLDDGTLVAGQPHGEPATGQRSADVRPAWSGHTDERTQEETTPQGERRIVTYHKASQFPLMVGVAIDMEDVLADWWDKARLILLGSVGVIFFVVAGAWALARELKKEEGLAQALRESGERLQATIDSAMDGIVIVDAEQRVALFNPAAEHMFGCTAQEAIGMPLERFLPERYRTAHRGHVERFGTSGIGSRVMTPQMDIVGLRADGREFPLESTISQVKLHGEMLYTAILRDVTGRRQAEEKLRESNRQLRELSGSLQTVREEERARIARELHDELGQQLTGLRMELSWLANHVRSREYGLAEKVDGMKQQIDTTIKSVRRIATELRPTLLDDLGLGAAIEWLAADFSHKTGIEILVDLAAADRARGDALVTALFRIVQESLTNAARHAAATQVRISLLQNGEMLELKIADNGKGMSATTKSADGGHGLVGIRERALMLGATATFESRPGAGTEIRIAIPLPGEPTTEIGA